MTEITDTSGAFEEARKILERDGYRIISPEEQARSRIQEEAREINAYIENKKNAGYNEIKVALQ